MTTEKIPIAPKQAQQDDPKHLPSEIDGFVDHFLATMCETTRRRILELLAQPQRNEPGSPLERPATEIAKALGLSPSTTSEHLKRLTNAGLIIPRREGTTIYYRLCNIYLVQAFHDLIAALRTEHATQRSHSRGKIVS